jgi:hypothetical protein
MKYALRAAITALSIANIPPAMAGDSSLNPDTFFTRLPGATAEAPAENVPSTERSGQAAQADTQPARGPWLFPPVGKYLDRQG